ncbi:hypothetical protein HanIR_Chr08g0364461 [Helianthus annuus]|nr:hypothetical protein HanIR_Chr08g0364461 [Helianthus annuus]
MEKLKAIGEELQGVFPNTMELRYLGGMKFLITFGSQIEAEDFRLVFREYWEELFTEVKEWRGGLEKFERLAWVKLVGIPIMLWSKEIGEKIGKSFGKVVYQERMNVNSGNLNETRLGIIVNTGKEIKEEVKVNFRGQDHTVWVSELSGIWAPEYIPGRCLILNQVIQKKEPDIQEVSMEEQTLEFRVPEEAPAAVGADNKEDESTSQEVKEERERNDRSQGESIFCENWETFFGENKKVNKEGGNNEGLEQNILKGDVKDIHYTGPISEEGFKAQAKRGEREKAHRRKKKPRTKEEDMLGRVFSGKNIKIPDLNLDTVDPEDPFQLDDLIWELNPHTKAVKRKKRGTGDKGIKKQRKESYRVPDLNGTGSENQEKDTTEDWVSVSQKKEGVNGEDKKQQKEDLEKKEKTRREEL